MTDIVDASYFEKLFVEQIPLLDVRAPVEFARGAFPNAVNIPLLDDEQRHQIGIRYKEAGQDAAIELGHQLINDEVRQQRLQAWRDFITADPRTLLYCFRGGLRSRLVQQWLAEDGVNIPRLAGGYKALRRFLINAIEAAGANNNYIVVAGKTGCGKTHLLNALPAKVDLEGCANHRGSAFGKRVDGQPGQIDFENRMAIALLQEQARQPHKIFLEDESRAIGSLSIPQAFFDAMRRSPLAVIEQPVESRVSTILNDYILANYRDFQASTEGDPFPAFAGYLLDSLERIKRRLGNENFSAVEDAMHEALKTHQQQDSTDGHRLWIEKLLVDYYDPMYDYQLGKKLDRIVFRGNADEFNAWAAHLSSARPDSV